MILTSRIAPHDTGAAEEVEDFFESSLGTIFPDDIVNSHGDWEHALAYTSPHLPRPLVLRLPNPDAKERALFSHHLWNASLQLAELIERDTVGGEGGGGGCCNGGGGGGEGFNVRGLDTIEFGAGSGLPSMMSALLGAKSVVVTDYPAPALLDTLKENFKTNVVPEASPLGTAAPARVEGHLWGVFGGPNPPPNQTTITADNLPEKSPENTPAEQVHDDAGFALAHKHAFDRVLAADCLWMPWQHENLRRSVSWFLRDDDDGARAWVVAGLHTKREGMRGFFDGGALARHGLEVERIWERDCEGVERAWEWDRGVEDPSGRKRWLIIAVLKRRKVEGNGRWGQG